MPLVGDAKRAYQLEWITKRRLNWLAENGPCKFCGSVVELEVHHNDPTQKLMNPSLLWSLAPTNPKRILELAKCIVLCEKCHLKETKKQKQKDIIHGSATMYRYGCRCKLCRQAASLDRRNYYKK